MGLGRAKGMGKRADRGGRGGKTHQSTGLACPVWVTSSGARYSGVPHRVKVFTPGASLLANPKSAIFRYPLESNSRFSGFRSLCCHHVMQQKDTKYMLPSCSSWGHMSKYLGALETASVW